MGWVLPTANVCCNAQANVGGALTVRLQQGLGAKAGVLALVLAQKGITGARDVLEGVYGFYQLYARGEYNPTRISDSLGRRFEIAETSLKPYPSCKLTHIPISAVLQLVTEHDVAPGDIEGIHVVTNSKGYNLCARGNTKYAPEQVADAQFSIPYTVAAAAVRRKVFIDDFTEDSIRDSKILELCQRVTVSIDPELDKLPALTCPNEIELRTRDGRQFTTRMGFVKGHPKNPMAWDECVDKFRRCIDFSARPLPGRATEEMIDMVHHLEDIDDVTDVLKLQNCGKKM